MFSLFLAFARDPRTYRTLRALLGTFPALALFFFAPFPFNSALTPIFTYAAHAFVPLLSPGAALHVAQVQLFATLLAFLLVTALAECLSRAGPGAAFAVVLTIVLALEPVLQSAKGVIAALFPLCVLAVIDEAFIAHFDELRSIPPSEVATSLWNTKSGAMFSSTVGSFITLGFVVVPVLVPPVKWDSQVLFTTTQSVFHRFAEAYRHFVDFIALLTDTEATKRSSFIADESSSSSEEDFIHESSSEAALDVVLPPRASDGTNGESTESSRESAADITLSILPKPSTIPHFSSDACLSLIEKFKMHAYTGYCEPALWPLGRSAVEPRVWERFADEMKINAFGFEAAHAVLAHSGETLGEGPKMSEALSQHVRASLQAMARMFDELGECLARNELGGPVVSNGEQTTRELQTIMTQYFEKVKMIQSGWFQEAARAEFRTQHYTFLNELQLMTEKYKAVDLEHHILLLEKEAPGSYKHFFELLFSVRNSATLFAASLLTCRKTRERLRDAFSALLSEFTAYSFLKGCGSIICTLFLLPMTIVEEYMNAPTRILHFRRYWKSGQARRMIQTILGVAFLFSLVVFIPGYRHFVGRMFGPWQVLAFYLTLEPSVESTFKKGVLRFTGNLAGGLLGLIFLVCFQAAGRAAWLVFVLSGVSLAVILWFIPCPGSRYTIASNVKYFLQSTGITILIVSFGAYQEVTFHALLQYTATRVTTQAIGVVTGCLISLVVFPSLCYRRTRTNLRRSLNLAGDGFVRAMNVYIRSWAGNSPLESELRSSSQIVYIESEVEWEMDAVFRQMQDASAAIDAARVCLLEADKLGHGFFFLPRWINHDDGAASSLKKVERLVYILSLCVQVISAINSETLGHFLLHSAAPFGTSGSSCHLNVEYANKLNGLFGQLAQAVRAMLITFGDAIVYGGSFPQGLYKHWFGLLSCSRSALSDAYAQIVQDAATHLDTFRSLRPKALSYYLLMWLPDSSIGHESFTEIDFARLIDSLLPLEADLRKADFLYALTVKVGIMFSAEMREVLAAFDISGSAVQ